VIMEAKKLLIQGNNEVDSFLNPYKKPYLGVKNNREFVIVGIFIIWELCKLIFVTSEFFTH
jgi:hypothetical protein